MAPGSPTATCASSRCRKVCCALPSKRTRLLTLAAAFKFVPRNFPEKKLIALDSVKDSLSGVPSMKNSNTGYLLGAWLVFGSIHACGAVLVTTDFEPTVNTLGGLNGQSANGPSPWLALPGAAVVNTGQVLGTQAANFSGTVAAGQTVAHSSVSLVPSGGVTIPVGWTLRAVVDIFPSSATPNDFIGIQAYGNTHADALGFFGVTGGGFTMGLAGTGSGSEVGNYSNPPNYDQWFQIGIEVTQTSANTLTMNYLFNGTPWSWNGSGTTYYTSTIGVLNEVSDFALVSGNRGLTAATVTGVYDNYRVELVPEPGTMTVLCGGLLLLLWRRRVDCII